MRNLALKLAYDGTDYVGWQVQPQGRSVQQALEEAIAALTGSRPRVLAAGRTDAGVHALGQVANFRTESRIATPQFRPGLQNFLPRDVLIREVYEVAESFHATHSALKKRYRYVIQDSRLQLPFLKNFAWHVRGGLEASAMHKAAQALIGRRDFQCFESKATGGGNSVRTVMDAAVSRCPEWAVWSRADLLGPDEAAAPFVCLEIEADGFLYNMVRAIVGTLLKIGRGQWSLADLEAILASRDRSRAGATAPPHGLYLVRVDYPPELFRNPEPPAKA